MSSCKPQLHLLQLNLPIFEQLQLEEALLRADERNWCLLNTGSPPAIVMGISGQLEKLVNQDCLHAQPIPVIRRFSGGGTVVIDENTEFATFIFNTTHLPVSPFPEPIMRWTETFYRPIFEPHPFQLQENDYVIHQQKCGGNAQSITKNRWLHHSSFLWDYQAKYMNYLYLPPKMPSYRQKRSHQEFLCRLKDYWDCQKSWKERIVEKLATDFELEKQELIDIQHVTNLPHRKATTLIQTSTSGLWLSPNAKPFA